MCGNSDESIYTDMAKYVHIYCRAFMKLTTTFRYVFWLSEVVDDGYGPTTVTTGMPMGDCFETGSCDISGISVWNNVDVQKYIFRWWAHWHSLWSWKCWWVSGKMSW